MTLGLEEFLKELKNIKEIIEIDFILDIRTKENTHWLRYNLNPDFQKKFPESFAPLLKQIKKEIKNQSKG